MHDMALDGRAGGGLAAEPGRGEKSVNESGLDGGAFYAISSTGKTDCWKMGGRTVAQFRISLVFRHWRLLAAFSILRYE
jgi:hypothetical protein